MTLTMAVVVDYQNVHLTAAKLFLPRRPPEEALVEPYRFACQLAQARNATNDDARQVSVSRVEVFRGLPIPEDDPDAYRRNQEQRAAWERGHHGVVNVTLRPLKYSWKLIQWASACISGNRYYDGPIP